jgi:hypothetical protein
MDGKPPNRNGFKHPRMNKPEGLISRKAATKINNCMQWLLMFSPKKRVYSKASKKTFTFRINFITLTLSGAQIHSDEFIKEHMLYPFLRWMGRSHSAKLYLWKAETQANGNIHFHITCNTFIHWQSIRRKWNQIQSKHGYLKKWTEGNVKGDPNSTDVHSVRDEDMVANYMVKYMLKNDESRRKVEGRVWACSPELSRMKIYIDQQDSDYDKTMDCIAEHAEIKKLDHATLLLHPKLSHIKKNPELFDRIVELYKIIAPKLNPQTHFTVE